MSFNPKTPKELVDAYENGLPGATDDPEGTEKLLSSLPMPLFGDALVGSGKGKRALLYKYLQKFEPEFGEYERQVTGDCVSHGTRSAIDLTRTFEILENKEAESYLLRGATEAIYGSRGHGGEGMSGSAAAKFVNSTSGVLLRQKYGNVDLSVYNGGMASNWGRSGVPRTLIEAGKQNPVETISLIKTVAQARDALANGYGIAVCSNYGFESKRDKNGISRKKGNWNHCMCMAAMDDTHELFNETLFLMVNSWGRFNSGPKRFEQPEGSFWIREGDAAGMLAQNGSWVFSNVKGFPPRKVNWTLNQIF